MMLAMKNCKALHKDIFSLTCKSAHKRCLENKERRKPYLGANISMIHI